MGTKAFLKKTYSVTSEFFANSSVHGFKYIGRRNSHVLERIFWILVCTAALMATIRMSVQLWHNTYHNPLIITYDPLAKERPNKFPAVIICHTKAASRSKLDSIIRSAKHANLNEENILKMQNFIVVPDNMLASDEFDELSTLFEKDNITLQHLMDIFYDISPSCQDFLVGCIWQSKGYTECNKHFKRVNTTYGLPCCEFDASKSHDEFTQPVDNSKILSEYSLTGINSGLRIVVDVDNDDFISPTHTFNGFKVLARTDGGGDHALDQVEDRGFIVGPGRETFVALNYVSLYHKQDVESLAVERRKCYIDKDRVTNLKLYDNYSRSSCILKWQIDKLSREFRCRPHFLANWMSNETMPICSFGWLKRFTQLRREQMVKGAAEHCYNTCDNDWYTFEVSSAPFVGLHHNVSAIHRFLKGRNKTSERLSKLNIFFQYDTGDIHRMNVRISTEEILSAIGGLLGIWLGFSLISVVELCFFTFKRWFSTNRNASLKANLKEDNKSKENEKIPGRY